MPDPLPTTPDGFFFLLLAGSGTVFGLLNVWLINVVLDTWQGWTHAPVSPTKQRWISIAVPLVLIFTGYFGLVAMGILAFNWQTFYSASVSALAAVGVKQSAHAFIQSAGKRDADTTDHDSAPAQDDAPVDSTLTPPSYTPDPTKRKGGF